MDIVAKKTISCFSTNAPSRLHSSVSHLPSQECPLNLPAPLGDCSVQDSHPVTKTTPNRHGCAANITPQSSFSPCVCCLPGSVHTSLVPVQWLSASAWLGSRDSQPVFSSSRRGHTSSNCKAGRWLYLHLLPHRQSTFLLDPEALLYFSSNSVHTFMASFRLGMTVRSLSPTVKNTTNQPLELTHWTSWSEYKTATLMFA